MCMGTRKDTCNASELTFLYFSSLEDKRLASFISLSRYIHPIYYYILQYD
jgi:hypothetical protein